MSRFIPLLLAAPAALCAPSGVDLFVAYSGKPGFPTCYRQPILLALNASHLIAFAEGRYNGAYCSGGVDGTNSSIWARVSADGGSTWGAATMLYDAPPQPDYLSAVFDARAGRAILHLQTAPYVQLHSDDAGATWSRPAPIAIALPAGVAAASPGVAHGIQLAGALCAEPTCGGAAGRLVVAWVCHKKAPAPALRAAGDVSCPGCFSCLATSDDGGASWAIAAAAVSTQEGSREAAVVQLPSASRAGAGAGAVVYVTERNMGATPGHRWHAVSLDGGRSLGLFGVDAGIPDVDTKNWTGIVAGAARIGGDVFISTPGAAVERADLTLFRSRDEAATWGAGELFLAGPAGYSDMVALNDTHGAILCENGEAEFAGKISFFVFAK